MDFPLPRLQVNGSDAGVPELSPLALAPYGHYSSMQIRDNAVRGFNLHLQRLDVATQELFGCALPAARVRGYLRTALDGSGGQGLSARITVYARSLGVRNPSAAVEPDVLISLSPPAAPAAAPMKVRSVRYAREPAHLKHTGTFNLIHQRRLALADGFDDALFVGAGGEISEGTIWNLGFYDGERILWPSAPSLPGVSMQLLQQCGIPSESRPLRLDDLGRFRCAFFSNSSIAVQPIAAIDGHPFAIDTDFFGELNRRYDRLPLQPV